MLTQRLLDSYLGKHIGEICLNGYADNSHNHCAHFVSHVLNLDFEMTCRNLVAGRQRNGGGANVRVHEVFALCPSRSEIRSCDTTMAGLIFVSGASNFVTDAAQITTLRNVPKKHIGILLEGNVWHYSNSKKKVVMVPSSEFLFHYPKQTNALWFGELPRIARASAFGTC